MSCIIKWQNIERRAPKKIVDECESCLNCKTLITFSNMSYHYLWKQDHSPPAGSLTSSYSRLQKMTRELKSMLEVTKNSSNLSILSRRWSQAFVKLISGASDAILYIIIFIKELTLPRLLFKVPIRINIRFNKIKSWIILFYLNSNWINIIVKLIQTNKSYISCDMGFQSKMII